jgi:phosphoglycerol transferase MdoB-like AlkP superfamily enzyme
MNNFIENWWLNRNLQIVFRVTIFVAVFFCLRLFFLIHNANINYNNIWPSIQTLFIGVYFDLIPAVALASPFILTDLLPYKWRNQLGFRKLLFALFSILCFLICVVELADTIYFPFNGRRSTMYIFNQLNDIKLQMPYFITTYYYIVFIAITIAALFSIIYYRIIFSYGIKYTSNFTSKKIGWFNALLTLGILYLCFMGFRGGWQARPLSSINATQFVTADKAPFIVTTTLCLLQSTNQATLPPRQYFSDEVASANFSFNRNGRQKNIIIGKPLNFVIIICESMSKHFSKKLSPTSEGYTPFLDSLMQLSLVCTNAYSNGWHSNEGNVSVNSSLPPLMPCVLQSEFHNNDLPGVASYLGTIGYASAFFHGGHNGSWNLDAYAAKAGYQQYFGEFEFNNNLEYDGAAGIWDEPFLQFAAAKISNLQEPFVSTIFTLTSHDPYYIPKMYINKFKKGIHPQQVAIQYTDYAIAQFFKSAKQQSWYNNTLFVIVADHGFYHTSLPHQFNTYSNRFGIPLILFQPSHPQPIIYNKIVQQIDILPTILDYANFKGPYKAFGNSLLDDEADRFVINETNGIFQLMNEEYLIRFDGSKTIELFNYKNDPFFIANLKDSLPAIIVPMEKKLKAILQVHDNAIIKNEFRIKN